MSGFVNDEAYEDEVSSVSDLYGRSDFYQDSDEDIAGDDSEEEEHEGMAQDFNDDEFEAEHRGPRGEQGGGDPASLLLRALQTAHGLRFPDIEGMGNSRMGRILEHLRNRSSADSVMVGLEELSDQLMNLRADSMIMFPADAMVKELVYLLRHPPPSPEALVMVARVIAQLIEVGIPHVISMLVDADVISALSARFQDIGYIDVAEQAISILERVSTEFPGLVLESGSPVTLLQFIDFFNEHIQRTILTVVGQCCAAITPANMGNATQMVPLLENHLSSGNPKLNDMAVGGMCQLINAISKKSPHPAEDLANYFNEDLWTTLITKITPSSPLLPKLFRALTAIAHNSPEAAVTMMMAGVAETASWAITQVDLSGKFEQSVVMNNLLHCSKDTLLMAVRFLGVLLPLPGTSFHFHGPYRRKHAMPPTLPQTLTNEALEKYSVTTAQTAMIIYSATADVTLRQTVLLVLLQIAWNLPPQCMHSIRQQVDLASFTCSVISQADTDSLTVGGIDLAFELVTKLPEIYMPEFAKKGLPNELAGALTEDAVEPKISTDTFALTSDLKPLKAFISEKILDLYRSSSSNFEKDISLNAEMVHHFACSDPPDWATAYALINDSTTMELLQLRLFDAIATKLQDADELLFLKEFDQQKILTLVEKLQDALSRSERFGVLSSFSGSPPSLLHTLTKHVNIRLEERNSSRSWPMAVHGVAAVENLEQFCLTRLALTQLFSGDDNLFRELAQGSDNDEVVALDRRRMDLDNETEGPQMDHSDDGRTPVGSHSASDEPGVAHEPSEDDRIMGEEDQAEQLDTQDDSSRGVAQFVDVEDEDDGPIAITQSSRSRTASELKTTPLAFYFNDQPLDMDMSIIGAIYKSFEHKSGDSVLPRSLWTDEFTISFEKKTKDTQPRQESPKNSKEQNVDVLQSMPSSFGSNPHLSGPLRLLSTLAALNDRHHVVPTSVFVNPKLTAKMNRQLEDALVVVSSIIPQWLVDCARFYPFLFPFQSRYTFVQSTSFGYSRSVNRWLQNTQSEDSEQRWLIGRLVRQKYRVSRSNLLSSALKVLQMSAGTPAMIEVEFYGEEGSGLGPTQEFYANTSHEFQKADTHMWRGVPGPEGYVYEQNGLFPRPMNKIDKTVIKLFQGMGKLMSRALLDQRILDFRLNPALFVLALGLPYNDRYLLEEVDPDLARSLDVLEKTDVESLCIDFTLPGTDIELFPGGSACLVTADRVQEYCQLVTDWTLRKGVCRQIKAFQSGFAENVPFEALYSFTPQELVAITGAGHEDWSQHTLTHSIKADHGYTMDSRPVQEIIEIMSVFDTEERRRFLQFMTGSPNLPIGGFKALSPPFTIVFKHPENESLSKDDYLPSVMTCANYLKLPNYSSKEIMIKRLWTAIDGGSGAFPLS